MARPRGFTVNPDALDDWLAARGLTKTTYCQQAEIGLSTLSGMTKAVDPKGASLPVALRMAGALRVRPGSLFPALIGKVDLDVAEAASDSGEAA